VPEPATFDRLYVVLVGARNPLNVGAAARAMSNFGFSRLRVVNPYPVAFHQARSAVGASDVLAAAEECATIAEAVADCALVIGTTAAADRRTLQHPLRRLELGARAIRKQLASAKVAVLFGSEKFGLSNEAFSHCNWLMHVPTSEVNISMNLGQAVAVCLYELARDVHATRKAPKVSAKKAPTGAAPATAAEVERITTVLRDAMVLSGYLKRKPTSDAEERLRRLVRRMDLPAGDAAAWLGILRQILWKLNNPEKEAR
jgi:TrmH family RNA methyltransferase